MTTVSVVLSVIERLDYLLLAEGAAARWAGGLRDGIGQLRSDLDGIEKFLSDPTSWNAEVDYLHKGVGRLAYDIEDAVESYAKKKAAPKRKPGVLRCLLKDPHSFRRRIDQLHRLRDYIFERAESHPIISSISTSTRAAPQNDMQLVNHPDVVGVQDDLMVLKSLTDDGQSDLSVIGICGMGGSGKTTLAQLLYNDPLIGYLFGGRGWATVGQEFQARDILETLLLSLSSSAQSKEKIAKMDTMELMDQVSRVHKGRRFLIVLDDVWSTELWDTIRFAFPDDKNGSRVIITTRMDYVAARFCTYRHQMKMLSEKDSWELLKKKLPPDFDEQLNPQIEMIGRQIARECRGLPLAITVIGTILNEIELNNWDLSVLRRMTKVPGFASFPGLKLILENLGLSYNELPFHLKPCFLYLGIFPPEQAIPVEKLYSLWIAEGLISTRAENDKTRVEVAEDYLNELVDRNLVTMVEKEEVSVSRWFKSCQLHNLIRLLCISQGIKEEFFDVAYFDDQTQKSSSASKVAIYLNNFEGTNDVLLNIRVPKNIRSILFLGTDESLPKTMWPPEFSDLKQFGWTRVLDFDGVDFRVKKLPRGIEKLIYLRYLSFGGCYLQEFPSSLSNFPFLETLDLRVRIDCRMTIPNVLRKISSLRHLYFPLAFRSGKRDKLKLDGLKKLEILENFHAGICDADDLLQLENLQILTGIVDGNNEDLKKITSFMDKNRLCQSSLVVKKIDCFSKGRFTIVAALLECDALRALDMEGYLGKLPHHGGIGSNFTEMVFNGSEFKKDPMPILGKLRGLRILVLWNNAFDGEEMVCSELDFPQLRSLKLVNLESLEKWEVKMGTMPSLTILTIEQCGELKMVPHGLKDIPALQELRIGSMPKGFQGEVQKMIEEMKDLRNGKVNASFYDC